MSWDICDDCGWKSCRCESEKEITALKERLAISNIILKRCSGLLRHEKNEAEESDLDDIETCIGQNKKRLGVENE